LGDGADGLIGWGNDSNQLSQHNKYNQSLTQNCAYNFSFAFPSTDNTEKPQSIVVKPLSAFVSALQPAITQLAVF
jgi:hypothetical protein